MIDPRRSIESSEDETSLQSASETSSTDSSSVEQPSKKFKVERRALAALEWEPFVYPNTKLSKAKKSSIRELQECHVLSPFSLLVPDANGQRRRSCAICKLRTGYYCVGCSICDVTPLCLSIQSDGTSCFYTYHIKHLVFVRLPQWRRDMQGFDTSNDISKEFTEIDRNGVRGEIKPLPPAVPIPLSPAETRTNTVYKIIARATGSLGGNGATGAIYGELTQQSMQNVLDALIAQCSLTNASRFLDVGSGLGKPNAHASQFASVRLSLGVELEYIRWQVSFHKICLYYYFYAVLTCQFHQIYYSSR